MRKGPRTIVAIGIIVLWLGGLGWLGLREHNKSFATKLAEGARLLAPVTYYYIADVDGTQIGSALSAVDTVGPRITKTDFIKTTNPAGSLRTTASLTRAFVLRSFRVQTDTTDKNIKVEEQQAAAAVPALLPGLAPIALMLTGEREVGRSQPFQLLEIFSGQKRDATLNIRAESLFTVVDSAMYDSVATKWIPAHSDTVRAWKVETTNGDISAWVDEQGRVIESTTKSGLHFTRTAYELVFRNEEKSDATKSTQRR